jgi:hypothetical protein
LTAYYKLTAAERCSGHVDRIQPLEGDPAAVKLTGWGSDRRSGDPLRDIVISADGRIAGFGVRDESFRPLSPAHGIWAHFAQAMETSKASPGAWTGYARVKRGTQSMNVYGTIEDSGNTLACELQGIDASQPVPVIR